MKFPTLPLLLSFCLFASAATAAFTDKGTWSTAGSLRVDSSTYVGTEIEFDLYLGKYSQDGMLIGGYVGAWDNDLITVLEGGAAFKLHFLDKVYLPLSPFVGADLGLAHCSTAPDDVFALVLGARLGFDLFLTDTAAFETSLDAHVATDDIYTDDGRDPLTNTDFRFKMGFAVFF